MLEKIPDRQSLLERFRKAQGWDRIWVGLEIGLTVTLVVLIDWKQVADEPVISLVAAVIIVGPVLTSIALAWAQNKRNIDQLKEQTRFGEFDKHRLRGLFQDTLQRLGLLGSRIPVFITPDRQLNASSANFGLTGLLLGMNGVYLNRQVLHKLTPAEVQDIMGHELGHYTTYWLWSSRLLELTFVLGALVGIAVAQVVAAPGYLGMFVQVAVGSLFWWLASLPQAWIAPTVELLCDDLGAQVQGINPSINGLLKIGQESELLYTIHLQTLLVEKKSQHLSPREIAETIQSAIPWGSFSSAELERSVQEALANRSRQNQQLSFTGFLKYIWQPDASDHDEILQTLEAQARALHRTERIEWEDLLPDPSQIAFDEATLGRLIMAMEEQPNSPLFHLPEEIGAETGGVHPPIKTRILYLWKNRVALEALRRSPPPSRTAKHLPHS